MADDERSDAVQLLVERALAVNPGFHSDHHTVELARRLGGLPLAIEIVAPWTRTLSTADIADRLDQLVAIGDHTRPERQQRMAAVFEWSDRRLDADTRRVYHRLGVFVGDFDLGAAEAVVPADAGERPGGLMALGRLVDHSLVIAETSSGPTRYRLLEPVRQFAADRLVDDGDDVPARDRHLLHYRSVALGIGKHATGPEAMTWLALADQEIANLRAPRTIMHSGHSGPTMPRASPAGCTGTGGSARPAQKGSTASTARWYFGPLPRRVPAPGSAWRHC